MSVVDKGAWTATPDAPTVTPAGIVAGDLLLLHLLGDGNAAHGFGTPGSPWTLLVTGSSSDMRADTYMRRASGTENAGVTLSTASSTPGLAVLRAFSGVDIATPVDTGSLTPYVWEYDGVTGLVEDIPGLAGSAGDMAVAFIGVGYPSSWTPSIDSPYTDHSDLAAGSGNLKALWGDGLYPSAGTLADLAWTVGAAVGAHGTDAVSNVSALLIRLKAAAAPGITGGITTASGFVPLEPGLHAHITTSGEDAASWSLDLGDGSALATGTFPAGPGPYDLSFTGVDIYTGGGVYSPTLTVTGVDTTTTATFLFGPIDALSVFITPAGAANTDSQATGTVFTRQGIALPLVDLTQYGYTADELPDPTVFAPTLLPIRQLALDRAPWTVRDGLPVDPPMMGAMSRSVAYSRSHSYTEDLADQVALGLQDATARWLADPGTLSGALWSPSFGAAPDFTLHTSGSDAPYIDPEYWYYARHERRKTVSAMVFDGAPYAQFGGSSAQAAFTWVVVAVLHHPASRSYYDVLASPSAATDPDRATDAALRYENGYVRAYAPARLASALTHPPTYLHRIRPVILAFGADTNRLTLGVVDGLGRHWAEPAHPAHASYDLRMKLGMNGGVNDAGYAAVMDVFDIMYWTGRRSAAQLANVITALDGVYGVTGR